MGIRSGRTFVLWFGGSRLRRKQRRLQAHPDMLKLAPHVGALIAVVGLSAVPYLLSYKFQSLLFRVHHRLAPGGINKDSRAAAIGHTLGTICLQESGGFCWAFISPFYVFGLWGRTGGCIPPRRWSSPVQLRLPGQPRLACQLTLASPRRHRAVSLQVI
jgi:hypothetical protein